MSLPRPGRVFLVFALLLASGGDLRSVQAQTFRPRRPFPQIDALLARKPNARIAVIQGSYDWVHNGHMELMRTIARDRHEGGYDLIVVVPTRYYERKPFLQASFSRRMRLLREAVMEDPELVGRVVVSRAASMVPNRPDQLVDSIAFRYPQLRFSYVVGGDSYNDSERWPWFRAVETHPQVEVVAVERVGYPILDPSRAARVLEGPRSTVSSTEIRLALMAGDLTRLEGQVPTSTMRGLARELMRRERERPPGGKLLGGPSYSERTFAEVRKEIPPNTDDLLDGLNEMAQPEAVRVRLVTTQERLNAARRELEGVTLHASSQAAEPDKEEQDRAILLAREQGRISGWYLFEPLAEPAALKRIALATLANLLGVPTPMPVPHVFRFRGSGSSKHGVLMPWAPGLVKSEGYDLTRATARVHEGLLLSRWFSEVMGAARARPEDFLHPDAGPERWDELLHEWGDAFTPTRPRSRGRPQYHSDTRIQWSPASYDASDSMFGRLFSDYVLGRINLDLAAVKRRLSLVKALPREVLLRALRPFLDAATDDDLGEIPLLGAKRSSRATFERRLIDRIYRSIDEYGSLLDRMALARRRPEHEIHRYYARAAESGP